MKPGTCSVDTADGKSAHHKTSQNAPCARVGRASSCRTSAEAPVSSPLAEWGFCDGIKVVLVFWDREWGRDQPPIITIEASIDIPSALEPGATEETRVHLTTSTRPDSEQQRLHDYMVEKCRGSHTLECSQFR